MEQEPEYKVGQEVWFMFNDRPEKSSIDKILDFGETIIIRHNAATVTLDVYDIAPTKEALRIKIFGE